MGGGSTVAQFLFDAYGVNMAQATVQMALKILTVIAATVQGMVMIYVLIIGKQLTTNSLKLSEGVTKLVRAIIVLSLMTATNYQAFIATPVTKTIPDFVGTMIGGQQGLTMADGWDGLMNEVDKFHEATRVQTADVSYLSDRIIMAVTAWLAKIVIVSCLFITMMANNVADFIMPLGAILLPFYLFDATRSFTERWYGKIFALFLVMIVNLMLSQVVVFQDAQYMRQFAANIAARPPDTGFDMSPNLESPLLFQPSTPNERAGPTINVDSAINTLGRVLVVFIFGLFLMVLGSGIALYIGGASGFSAAPMFNAIMSVARFAVRR
jgi:hypothetical protein